MRAAKSLINSRLPYLSITLVLVWPRRVEIGMHRVQLLLLCYPACQLSHNFFFVDWFSYYKALILFPVCQLSLKHLSQFFISLRMIQKLNIYFIVVSGCFTACRLACLARCHIKKTVLKQLTNGWIPGKYSDLYTRNHFFIHIIQTKILFQLVIEFSGLVR